MNRSTLSSGLFLILAIAGLVAVLTWPETEAVEAEQAGGDFRFPVTGAEVTVEPVLETAQLVGDVISARRSRLTFDRSGTVSTVQVRVGDRVAAGQVLARLDDRVLQKDLHTARAAVEVARGESDFAASEAQRAQSVGDDVISESERERMVSEAAVAARRLAQREAEVAKLEAQMDQGVLKAPFAGVIARRMLDEGSQAGPGFPVFDLVDTESREVRLEVPTPLVASLGVGSSVRLTLDDQPGWELLAELDALVPAADPGSRSFTAVIRIDGSTGDSAEATAALLPGLFVRAELKLRQIDGQPTVPIDSLVVSDQGAVVYVIQAPPAEAGPAAPSTAKLIPVRVLARSPERAAVQPFEPGALQPGMEVVLTGVQNIFPEAPLGVQLGA